MEKKKVPEKRFSLTSMMSAVQGCSTDYSAPIQTLFRNQVGEQVFRNVLRYDPKEKDESYVEGSTMSIDRVDAWVEKVTYCSLEKQKCGEIRQKE